MGGVPPLEPGSSLRGVFLFGLLGIRMLVNSLVGIPTLIPEQHLHEEKRNMWQYVSHEMHWPQSAAPLPLSRPKNWRSWLARVYVSRRLKSSRRRVKRVFIFNEFWFRCRLLKSPQKIRKSQAIFRRLIRRDHMTASWFG